MNVQYIEALKARSPKLVQFDQSATRIRCDVHGKHVPAYFVADGVPAQYVCSICWDATSANQLSE